MSSRVIDLDALLDARPSDVGRSVYYIDNAYVSHGYPRPVGGRHVSALPDEDDATFCDLPAFIDPGEP